MPGALSLTIFTAVWALPDNAACPVAPCQLGSRHLCGAAVALDFLCTTRSLSVKLELTKQNLSFTFAVSAMCLAACDGAGSVSASVPGDILPPRPLAAAAKRKQRPRLRAGLPRGAQLWQQSTADQVMTIQAHLVFLRPSCCLVCVALCDRHAAPAEEDALRNTQSQSHAHTRQACVHYTSRQRHSKHRPEHLGQL